MALPPLELFSLSEKATLLPGGLFVFWKSDEEGFFGFAFRMTMRVREEKFMEPTTGVEPVTY
jgi:hypothetical protein